MTVINRVVVLTYLDQKERVSVEVVVEHMMATGL
jgi:hypothetical protein